MKKSEARAKKLQSLDAESLFSNLLSDSERKHLHQEDAFSASEALMVEDSDLSKLTVENDLDFKDFMGSLLDPVTGTVRDFRIDDRDLPAAVNYYDFCFNIIGKDAHPPWARQFFIAVSLLGEICPHCSNKKYLNIHNIPKDFPTSDLVSRKRLVLLENGICPVCGRTKHQLISSGLLNNYNQGVYCLGQRCVSADTMLYTDRGIEYIGDMLKYKHPLYDVYEKKIFNGRTLEQSSHSFITSKEESLYQIALHDGGILKCTGDHPIMTDQGWKKAKDLKIDDCIEIIVGANCFGNEVPTYDDAIKYTYDSLKQRPNNSFVDGLTGKVTKEFFTLLGLWVSDGCSDGISQKDEDVSSFIKQEFTKIFANGFNHRPERYGHIVSGNLTAPFLRYFLGDLNKGSYNQCIPDCVLHAPKEYVCAFLKGLFEGDGCIGKDGGVGYSTVSHKLILELRVLMYNLGFHPVVSAGYKTYKGHPYLSYGLTISHKELKLYKELIGFMSKPKIERLDTEYSESRNDQPINYEKTTPYIRSRFVKFINDCRNEFQQLPREDLITSYESKRSKIVKGKSILPLFGVDSGESWVKHGTEHLKRLRIHGIPLLYSFLQGSVKHLITHKDEFPEYLQGEIFYFKQVSNKFYSKIVSISRTEPELAYDLVMPETHRFIGNAIVNHNSGKSSTAAEIAAYTLHKYMKYPMLAELSPYMQKSTQLTGIFCSLTFKKALEVLWTPFKNIVDSSQWFKDYFDLLEDYRLKTGNKLLYNSATKLAIGNKNLYCFPTGPTASTLRGNTSFMCFLDELGLFPPGTNEEVDDDVNRRASPDEAYTSLLNSLATVTSTIDKLRADGYNSAPPSFMLSVSSPISNRDKIMRLLKQSETDNSIYGIQLPTWEVNPTLERSSNLIASAFKANPVRALRDFGAQPTDASMAFFDGKRAAKLFVGPPPTHQLIQRSDEYETWGELKKLSAIQYPSIMSLDAGYSNNSFSVSVLYYDFVKNKTVLACSLECMPIQGKVINFNKMYHNVILPLAKDLNVCYICADRWNSIDLLHRLREDMGLAPNKKSFVRGDFYSLKRSDFDAVKASLSNDTLIFPFLQKSDIENTLTKAVDDYRVEFFGKPLEHLLLQFATVVDVGPAMCPDKAPGLTDDILRTVILGLTKIHSEKVSNRLSEFRQYIKAENAVAMPMPIVSGRSFGRFFT